MKTQKQLYEKYLSDLKKLQHKCKHEQISGWMEEYWAPGHSTGRQIRTCEICAVVVDVEKHIQTTSIITSNDYTTL